MRLQLRDFFMNSFAVFMLSFINSGAVQAAYDKLTTCYDDAGAVIDCPSDEASDDSAAAETADADTAAETTDSDQFWI